MTHPTPGAPERCWSAFLPISGASANRSRSSLNFASALASPTGVLAVRVSVVAIVELLWSCGVDQTFRATASTPRRVPRWSGRLRRDRVEDDRGVFRRCLFPDEVTGVDEREAAVGQSGVEEFGVGDRHDAVMASVDDRHRRRDLPGRSSASSGSCAGYERT